VANIKIRSTILVQEISSYSLKTKLRELIIPAYIRGDIDLESALLRLKLSRRQFYRLKQRYLESGVVSHQLINKPSNHRISDEVKAKVIELYKSKYTGWNYEHIHDSLEWRDGIKVSSDTIRNILLDSGLTKAKQRKGRKYERRQPKARFNELVQLDGTFGDFLGDGRLLCLMHMVDDATKTSMAILTESECTQSVLRPVLKCTTID
jgi:transposase